LIEEEKKAFLLFEENVLVQFLSEGKDLVLSSKGEKRRLIEITKHVQVLRQNQQSGA
jgi:hypothetical protein